MNNFKNLPSGLGLVAHICDASTQDEEVERPWVRGQPMLQSKFQATVDYIATWWENGKYINELELIDFEPGPIIIEFVDDLLESIVFWFGPSFKFVLFNIIISAI